MADSTATHPDGHVVSTPIVGIGASSGGLTALIELTEALPCDTGLAFVVITHLTPNRKSSLPEILQRGTTMPVIEVTDRTTIKANSIYVISNSTALAVSNHVLRVVPNDKRTVNLPIVFFLTSLAKDQGQNAACIILSGTGHDGTAGSREIKKNRGLVMAQDPSSAKFPGMPTSTIETGLVDEALHPADMPKRLMQYFSISTTSMASCDYEPEGILITDSILQRIFERLRRDVSHDFSLYKKSTLYRRIQRRMTALQQERIEDYVQYLEEDDGEVEALFNEILIGVTSFFRDPGVFEYLANDVFPKLIKSKDQQDLLRIWVPGCSTGEEVYSIAIVFHEVISRYNSKLNLQIFGTDISSLAIQTARKGLYPFSINQQVSEARLARYFTETDVGGYKINQLIREMVVFAEQNITSDPPFTKLDFLSCRNLFIYFQPLLQDRIMPILHYSLNPDGVLLFGSSESIGRHSDLFETTHKKWKVHRRKRIPFSYQAFILPRYKNSPNVRSVLEKDMIPRNDEEVTRYVEAILQQSAMPPCAIIDADSKIVYIHGRTGKFLEPAVGRPSTYILDMARSGLQSEMATAIRQVRKTGEKCVKKKLTVLTKEPCAVNLIVTPVSENVSGSSLLMVAFEEVKDANLEPPTESSHAAALAEEELRTTRERLRALTDELQSYNEELKSANEELQSTNEELETSKEELQSLNEESITVNSELQSRIDELTKTADDMKNLLDSTNIAAIFLDADLRITNHTPRLTDIISLEPADRGRRISNFTSRLEQVDLGEFSNEILNDLVIREIEVTSTDGTVYMLRGRPYRTLSNVIAGIVLTFEDVTQLKLAQQLASSKSLEASEKRFTNLLHAFDHGILIAESSGHILAANPAFCNLIGYSESELQLMEIHDFTLPTPPRSNGAATHIDR